MPRGREVTKDCTSYLPLGLANSGCIGYVAQRGITCHALSQSSSDLRYRQYQGQKLSISAAWRLQDIFPSVYSLQRMPIGTTVCTPRTKGAWWSNVQRNKSVDAQPL